MEISWEKGGKAQDDRAQAERVELYSSIAGAPGTRLMGTLSSGTGIWVRVAKCRRLQGEDLFVIEGKLLDATRAVMAEVQSFAEKNGDARGASPEKG